MKAKEYTITVTDAEQIFRAVKWLGSYCGELERQGRDGRADACGSVAEHLSGMLQRLAAEANGTE